MMLWTDSQWVHLLEHPDRASFTTILNAAGEFSTECYFERCLPLFVNLKELRISDKCINKDTQLDGIYTKCWDRVVGELKHIKRLFIESSGAGFCDKR